MNIRNGLAAGGVIAAIAVAAAGCGSSNPGGSGGGTAAATVKPTWAAGLGSGVTIYAPASASAGNGSPQAVVTGLVAAEDSGDYVAVCQYYEPSTQAQCKSQISAEVSASPSALASAVGHPKNFAIGYTAIHGTEALVGSTGTFCAAGDCFTNTDPAALLSSGKSFSALWTTANSSSGSNSYALAPCFEVGGKWYLYTSAS